MVKTNAAAFFASIICSLLSFAILTADLRAASQDNEAAESDTTKTVAGQLIKVPLPIDGRSALTVRQALQQIADQSKQAVRKEDRPVVVLEFDTSRGADGRGSTLGACFDLARLLASSKMSRVRTIAYVAGTKIGNATAEDPASQKTQLAGHAVLVALAADELAMHPDASIGNAGVDEIIDDFVRQAYENVVSKRLPVPVPVAMAMLDKDRELYRVETADGVIYADQTELKSLEAKTTTLDTKTLSAKGVLAEFSGKKMAELGLLRHEASSRVDLARKLGISQDSLQAEMNQGKPWKAIRIELPDYIDETALQWITRAMQPKVSSGEANLIVLDFDSTGGDLDACLLMARSLAAYDPEEIRTVAYVDDEAVGAAAMLAMSCQHVVLHSDARLGGEFEAAISDDVLEDLKTTAAGIAESLGRDPALIQSMLDPTMEVFRYRNKKTGKERLFTESQHDALPDADVWLQQGPHETIEPMDAATAEQRQVARQVVSSFDELKSFYQLEEEPELLKPTSVDRWLHEAALFLASPFVAPWLLFLAMFMLFNEISQPGLGVPGFLGTVCLILYFWSQHLGGNADWLEILLFLAGIVFLMLELFVVPGFGLFGIGGLVMVVVSIVLASQTFIIPTTSEEFNQLPKSMFALAGAFGGMVVGMLVLRTVLPKTPFFKHLMLEPPTNDSDGFEGSKDRDSMVDWGHLVGRRGSAITNLVPAGKAKIAGQLIDVISDGRLIEKGQHIEVMEVAGNRVVVNAVDES